jgi:Uma2 family endonuclease
MATDTTKFKSLDRLSQLRDGMRMDRETFHRLYEQTPEGFKAELIGGVVHMAAAMRVPHAEHAGLLRTWLTIYRIATPGVREAGDATVLLGDESEPQPDGLLWIEGGNARLSDDEYLVGAPEFVAEVADSTVGTDLGVKREDYERHGVAEYLVIDIRRRRAVWFIRDENGGYVELAPDESGLLKSRVFPGLWLDPKAFCRLDGVKVLEVAREGQSSPEHDEFVAALARKRQ